MLTATVTKKSVVNTQPKVYTIVLNLTLKEDTLEVLNKDMSFQFDSTDTVQKKILEITRAMQDGIDNYKAAKVIFDSTVLNNAVQNIQGGLVC